MYYEERFYRYRANSKFKIEVCYRESDLFILTSHPVKKEIALSFLKNYYEEVSSYTKENPLFLSSLSPLDIDKKAPLIVQDMIKASQLIGVGPFATVAGAIAFYVGNEILNYSKEVIIENGGDIFLKINEDKKIGVYLGNHFDTNSNIIFLKVKKKDKPFGIASSSAFIGHSLNFGRADLVTVIAKDAILADGFATALSNRIKKEKDIKEVLEFAKGNPFIEAILIAFEKKIYLWGDIEIYE